MAAPTGPQQPGKPWHDVGELLQRVLAHFHGADTDALDECLLQAAYSAFVDRAEAELAQLTDTKLKHAGLRIIYPKLVWKSVMLAPRPVQGKEAELHQASLGPANGSFMPDPGGRGVVWLWGPPA